MIRARAYPLQPDPQTYLQHGYLQNQFSRMFGQLADVYGHIFRVGRAKSIWLISCCNAASWWVMLPALEKSPDELASLGKLLIGALKPCSPWVSAPGWKEPSRGDRPPAGRRPFARTWGVRRIWVLRGPGFAVVPAQARSLGFRCVFGGQDLQSFGKASREEAAAIVANTLTKVGMFVEDPQETMELFEKLGGQALAVQGNGLTQSDHALLAGFYRAAPNAVYERRPASIPRSARSTYRRGACPARDHHCPREAVLCGDVPVSRVSPQSLCRPGATGHISTHRRRCAPAVADGVATPWTGRQGQPCPPRWPRGSDRHDAIGRRRRGGILRPPPDRRLFAGQAEQEAVREDAVRRTRQGEEPASQETVSTVDPPTAADTVHPPVPSDEAIRATVEAVIAESVRQDTPAGVEIPPLEAAEKRFRRRGVFSCRRANPW